MADPGLDIYELVSRVCDAGDLVVFSATARAAHPAYAELQNRPLEAHAFWKGRDLPQKLYDSRKRRIRRLRNSPNTLGTFENEGLRVVVCHSPGEGVERHRKKESAALTHPPAEFHQGDFPGLLEQRQNEDYAIARVCCLLNNLTAIGDYIQNAFTGPLCLKSATAKHDEVDKPLTAKPYAALDDRGLRLLLRLQSQDGKAMAPAHCTLSFVVDLLS
ncbi:uncharacterized protein PG998_004971 [Apiospora kogelbergensis]|uniref:Uncharacterized protein n=1 Tax=Apiospora kogelbergensis TaxID=1337665 RepID=A0AAW0Q999_9PEZI